MTAAHIRHSPYEEKYAQFIAETARFCERFLLGARPFYFAGGSASAGVKLSNLIRNTMSVLGGISPLPATP
jgi:hypothetical protein